MAGEPCEESRLVLCTGAPGSKWSRVVRLLCESPLVDNSDWSPARCYNDYAHFGNYLGPGMEFGERIAEYERTRPTRSELLAEFARPYGRPQGGRYRLIKSHAFAYALPFLRGALPAARVLLVWREDARCLSWWLQAGGFSITYPSYSWYRDEATMRRAIAAENAHILEFARASGVELASTAPAALGEALGLWPPGGAPESVRAERLPDDVRVAVV